MNLRRLALASAIGSAFAAPAHAQSSVTLYGMLDAYVGRVENTVPDSKVTSVGSGGLQTSYFGVRGVEDLGGGLKAVFALESFLNVDTGFSARFPNDTFWSRTAYVGLSSDAWGTIALGRNTTPYFLAVILWNPLVDSFVVGPMITHTFRGNVLGDTGMSNSIRWTSPSWGGFKADLLYSLGEERSAAPDKDFGKAIDAVLSYGAGPFGAVLGYRQIDQSVNGNGREQSAVLIGASYAFSWAKFFVQYQMVSETFAQSASDVDRNTLQLGVSVPLFGGNALFSYATMDIDDTVATTPSKRDTWALAYVHPLSKRTELYGAYYSDVLKSPDGNEQTVLAAGIRHRF